MSEENINARRRAYVQREIAREASKFPKSDEITRQITPIALRAVEMFDTRQYAQDEVAKFFEDGASEATMQAIYFEMLSAAVIQGKKWCDVTHEHPKSCDCAELLKVILGLVPAVTPLGEANE